MIEVYVRDVRRALGHECWFAALSLALALPDICGMAEFPNKTVGERYIGWYDRYVAEYRDLYNTGGDTPCISGEIVYNLRNTFLHQGKPTINSDKVNAERNQLDRFMLVLGDGSKLHFISHRIEMANVTVRTLTVDVAWLCAIICDCALAYYQNHREAFAFEYNFVLQDFLFAEKSPLDDAPANADPLGDFLLEKLGDEGRNLVIKDNVTQLFAEQLSKAIETAPMASPQGAAAPKPPKPKAEGDDKREHRLRCFFGQHFKEKKYAARKEDIIRAYLSAHTKTQLNANLTRLFPGEDVKVILARLKPLTADWPGH